MDDALLVCVLDGLANFNEQVEAFGGRKIGLVAILGDFYAAHQFHDEVRPAGLGRPAIKFAILRAARRRNSS